MIIDISRKSISIGTIEFSDSINEYSIEKSDNLPNIKKLGICDVVVYGNEGKIPHLHVKSNNGDVCICLHTNKYFSHNPKYIQFSSSSRKKEFDNWMRLPNKKISNEYNNGNPMANYEAAVRIWEMNNGKSEFNMTVQPNYSVMLEEIQKKK